MTILYYYKVQARPRVVYQPAAPVLTEKKRKKKKLKQVFAPLVDYQEIAARNQAEIDRLTELLQQQAEAERKIWADRVNALELQAQELRAALEIELRLEAERALLASALQALNGEITQIIQTLVAKKLRQDKQEKELQLLVELDEIASVSSLM